MQSLEMAAPADSESPRPFLQRVRFLAVYLGIWILILAAFAAQYRLGIELSWPRSITRVLVGWSPWILLGPVVWWLAKQFPIFESRRRLRNILMHLCFSLVLILTAEVMIIFAVAPAVQALVPQGLEAGEGRLRERPLPPRRQQQQQNRVNSENEFRVDIVVRKAQFWFPLYWVLVFLTSSNLHYRDAQKKERKSLQLQRDLAKAQLQSIQSRLEPHFLFNTLNSISTLVYTNPGKADEMIGQLSDLLRQVLARSETQEILLREEMGLLRDYLAIQKIRFPDRLQIREEIDEDTLDGLVPTLILQPLAENAVRHGIEPKAEPSTLLISSQRDDKGNIELVVEDDGIGWENSPKSSGSSGGIGLSNIRSRLDSLYEEKGTVNISTPPGGGTRISIRFPYSSKPNQNPPKK